MLSNNDIKNICMKRKMLGLNMSFITSYLQMWDGAIVYRSINPQFLELKNLIELRLKTPVCMEIRNNKKSLMTTFSGQHWIETDRDHLYNVIAFKDNKKKVFSSDENYRSCVIQAGNDWDKIELVIRLERDMSYRDL